MEKIESAAIIYVSWYDFQFIMHEAIVHSLYIYIGQNGSARWVLSTNTIDYVLAGWQDDDLPLFCRIE